MKRHWLLLVIAVNLVGAALLAFAYQHLMVAPGALKPEHAALATDCFACHAPLRGAAADRCIACHVVADIGLKTTRGVAVASASTKVAFHQQLKAQDCTRCHSDHAGPQLVGHDRKPFSHKALREDIRGRCESCHAPAKTAVHENVNAGCAQCHTTAGWKPARFDHAVLSRATFERCETCHKPPGDAFHRGIAGGCAQCHTPQGWKATTFDHAKFFVLDGDHNAGCTTCHTTQAFKQYTCYGCHEHTPDNIRRKHEKEGIRDFGNCVACHRSARGEGGGGDDHEGRAPAVNGVVPVLSRNPATQSCRTEGGGDRWIARPCSPLPPSVSHRTDEVGDGA